MYWYNIITRKISLPENDVVGMEIDLVTVWLVEIEVISLWGVGGEIISV